MGYCKDCSHRNKLGYCKCSYIKEDCGDDSESDVLVKGLVYDYCEGGGFKVGDYFGCVHWKSKQK